MLRKISLAGAAIAAAALQAETPTVTFHKDVESILQRICQTRMKRAYLRRWIETPPERNTGTSPHAPDANGGF